MLIWASTTSEPSSHAALSTTALIHRQPKKRNPFMLKFDMVWCERNYFMSIQSTLKLDVRTIKHSSAGTIT